MYGTIQHHDKEEGMNVFKYGWEMGQGTGDFGIISGEGTQQ